MSASHIVARIAGGIAVFIVGFWFAANSLRTAATDAEASHMEPGRGQNQDWIYASARVLHP